MLGTIISLISGAVGGNVAGALMKKYSMGTLGNSIVGILGGGLGSYILGALGIGAAASTGADAGSLDMATILGTVGSGGVGGGVLMVIVGMIKNAMAK